MRKKIIVLSGSPRLQAIYSYLQPGVPLLDVGSGHAKLCIAAIESEAVPYAIATEIAESPLDVARQAVADAGLTERIQLIRCDGLQGIDLVQPAQVVIAGMGGATIARILSDDIARGECKRDSWHFILQPMDGEGELRLWLAAQGWTILAESIVREGKHFYQIIEVIPGGTPYQLDWLTAQVGEFNLASGQPEVVAYLQHLFEVRAKAIREVEQGMPVHQERLEELRRERELVQRTIYQIQHFIAR